MPQLPVSALDYVTIPHGSTATEALGNAVNLAVHVERLGYRRMWFSEHHNNAGLACSAPEIIIARVAAATTTLRVGSGGIMLPNQAPLKVAETFRTLEAFSPGRIDLGLGRAPGTDGITAVALRGSRSAVLTVDFPKMASELFAFLGGQPGSGTQMEGFPDDHPFHDVVASPVIDHQPEIWILGSSDFGATFAAQNGLPTAFAHQINPDPAIQVLREYRRDFRPTPWRPEPRSMISVTAFVADDTRTAREFDTYWSLVMRKLAAGDRTPTTMADARALVGNSLYSSTSSDGHRNSGRRLFCGTSDEVASRILDLGASSEVDELMVVTPVPDHHLRSRSFELLAKELDLAPPTSPA